MEITTGKEITATVISSYGEVIIDAVTGAVIESRPFEEGDDYLAGIVQFDLPEWKLYWDLDPVHSYLDILDLGFWFSNGAYEAAEPSWRLRTYTTPEAALHHAQKKGDLFAFVGKVITAFIEVGDYEFAFALWELAGERYPRRALAV